MDINERLEKMELRLSNKLGMNIKLTGEPEEASFAAEFNPALHSLRDDFKYYFLKGGRSSSKTTSIVSVIIEYSYSIDYRNRTFLMLRRTSSSHDASLMIVFINFILENQLQKDFLIKAREFTNIKTGVTFKFKGLNDLKAAINAKGIPDIGIIYVEEGENIPLDYLNMIDNTAFRNNPHYKFFSAWNPYLISDDIEKFAQAKDAMGSSKVFRKHINYMENPYLDDETLGNIKAMEALNVEKYNHEYLGLPTSIDGSPFVHIKEVVSAPAGGMITSFLDPSFTGGDFTAITAGYVHNGILYIAGMSFQRAWNSCIHEIDKFNQDLGVTDFYCENNAIGTTPIDIFNGSGLQEPLLYTTTGNKMQRIFRASTWIKDIRLVTHLCNHQYISNLKAFHSKVKHDDEADSLASLMIVMGIIPNK